MFGRFNDAFFAEPSSSSSLPSARFGSELQSSSESTTAPVERDSMQDKRSGQEAGCLSIADAAVGQIPKQDPGLGALLTRLVQLTAGETM